MQKKKKQKINLNVLTKHKNISTGNDNYLNVERRKKTQNECLVAPIMPIKMSTMTNN